MVLGYHIIFTAYGFWLPNDPRGSWSDFVGSWELLRFGRATKTTERRSLAHVSHDRAWRLAAKQALKYPAVSFNNEQVQTIAAAFGERVTSSKMTVWACANMPEHVHMVIARHHYDVERAVVLLKSEATTTLLDQGRHPFQNSRDAKGKIPQCWARGEWKVFLNTPEDIARAIRYVEQNPIKEGRSAQHFPFVIPYLV